MESKLEQMAAGAGHTIEFHTGNTNGRGSDELRRMIERSELVIVLTDVNSHGGVQQARKVAGKLGRGVLLARKLGASRFKQLLEALSRRESLEAFEPSW